MQVTIPGSSLLVVMPDSGTDAKRWSQESLGSIPTPGIYKKQLRDRLTVGSGALNGWMLVRFQLPQLTEVIRPDEEVVLKTTGRICDLWVRVPRLPLIRAHGPTGRHKLRTLEIWVRFPVSPLV